jgi:hypothetical protein
MNASGGIVTCTVSKSVSAFPGWGKDIDHLTFSATYFLSSSWTPAYSRKLDSSRMSEGHVFTISAVAKDIKPDGFEILSYLSEAGGANLHGISNPFTLASPRWDKIEAICAIAMLLSQAN